MKPDFLKFVLSLILVATATSEARADDLKVVFVTHSANGEAFTTTRYYKDERVRVEWRDHASWKPGVITYAPPRATIWQCDSERVFDLNLASHQFTVKQLSADCQATSAHPLPVPQGTIDVYTQSADTGERRQILGRTARHIITHQRQIASPLACSRDAELDVDGWYLEMQEPKAAQKLRGHSAGDNVMMTGANCRPEIKVHRTGVERPGLAVKLIQTWRSSVPQPDGTSKQYTSRWETEITELSDDGLDESLFDLPPGFTEVARIDARPEMPFSVAVDYWWHRAVHAVRSWF